MDSGSIGLVPMPHGGDVVHCSMYVMPYKLPRTQRIVDMRVFKCRPQPRLAVVELGDQTHDTLGKLVVPVVSLVGID